MRSEVNAINCKPSGQLQELTFNALNPLSYLNIKCLQIVKLQGNSPNLQEPILPCSSVSDLSLILTKKKKVCGHLCLIMISKHCISRLDRGKRELWPSINGITLESSLYVFWHTTSRFQLNMAHADKNRNKQPLGLDSNSKENDFLSDLELVNVNTYKIIKNLSIDHEDS